MSVSHWLTRVLKLGDESKPEAELTEHKELMEDAYTKVEEVSKLRENLFENREFPITSYLRGYPPVKHTRRRIHG